MLREGILTSGAFAANIDSKKPTLLGMCTTAPLWPIVGGLGAVQGYTCQVSKLTQHPASPFWLTSLAGRSADGMLPLAEFLTHPPLPEAELFDAWRTAEDPTLPLMSRGRSSAGELMPMTGVGDRSAP